MTLPKPKNILTHSSAVGLFDKKEAAEFIVEGCRHVHSSILGQKDPLVKTTYQSLEETKVFTYSWESTEKKKQLFLRSSSQRKEILNELLSHLEVKPQSSLGDRVGTAFEELLTNSIFHSYLDTNKLEKYPRNQVAHLDSSEHIAIEFCRSNQGVFVSVRDYGQGLKFSSIQSSFKRCYSQRDESQVEKKLGGAGLGMFVIFELATHLKIVTFPGKGTLTNCWFAPASAFDPNHFSFNFFEGDKP